MSSRIETYGFIGNTRTAALISDAGAVDWLCMPRFDSEACFAALLGFDQHGTWSIRPTTQVLAREQRYRKETLILETDVVVAGGSARLIEFMPVGERSELVRIVVGLDGEVPLYMMLSPRFGYGSDRPWLTPVDGGCRFVAGPDALVVRGPVAMQESDAGIVSNFTVKRGDRVGLSLTWYPSNEREPEALADLEVELLRCERFWLDWSQRCDYRGEWRDAVVRSLLTLKGLTYSPTGAVIAAPTLGLPEELGGVRNWDYRFCWVRDATLTLHAMMLGGYTEEAGAFRDWLMRAAAGAPREMQLMYKIDGSRRLTEFELPWLPGYEASRPVRAGNAASEQFQLDIYGELLGAVYQARRLGLPSHPEGFRVLEQVVRFVASSWQKPDDGIWEVRGGRKHFTHSKVMAWVAIDRAARLLEESPNGASRWELLQWLRALRERIHEDVLQHGFHPGVNSFTQSYGSEVVDASLLLIPRLGFLPATDPRVLGTVAAVERTLLRDGLVLRYDTGHGVDGLAGEEGAFLACSFWLCDNYALTDQLDKAEELFERLLSLRSPLGLLAEEYDPSRRRQVGNFPQGFSHLALISSAHTLGVARDRAERGEAGTEDEDRSYHPPPSLEEREPR